LPATQGGVEMFMLLDNVLIIYKKSLYQIYFMERRQQLASADNRFEEADMARYKEAHEAHTQALHKVCRTFDAEQVPYRLVYRARQLDYAPYSLVVAVGGDGTFIEAARRITTQPILGVNSDPKRSLGVFCATTGETFPEFFPLLRPGVCKESWGPVVVDRRQ